MNRTVRANDTATYQRSLDLSKQNLSGAVLDRPRNVDGAPTGRSRAPGSIALICDAPPRAVYLFKFKQPRRAAGYGGA